MEKLAAKKDKALLELSQAALKAAAAAAAASGRGADESRCIEAFTQLKSFHVSLEVLSSVKDIVERIKSLKTHPSKKIQKLADDLITSWKKKVLAKKLNNKTATANNNELDKDQETSSLTIGNDSQIQKQVPQIRSTVPKCNNSLRDKIREKVFQALCMVFNEAEGETRHKLINSCDPVRVAVCIEMALFGNWGASSDGKNRSKYRSLLYNIKDPKNPDFRRKLLAGEIKAESVATMNPSEMASEERQLENEKIRARALKKCMVRKEGDGTVGSDLFKCEKCGKKETTYFEMQTRSADEPMTAYITCINCSYNWKQ